MRVALVFSLLLVISGCSETPIEEQDEQTAAETEKQIEADAKTLEEAADEAVTVLEAEIEDELRAEGVGQSQSTAPASEPPTAAE